MITRRILHLLNKLLIWTTTSTQIFDLSLLYLLDEFDNFFECFVATY